MTELTIEELSKRGFSYFHPGDDNGNWRGLTWSERHPVESGDYPQAEDITPCTLGSYVAGFAPFCGG